MPVPENGPRRPWRWWATALHRDIGFFFAGTVLIYALSGLAVNHIDHWNPDFIIERQQVTLDLPSDRDQIDRAGVLAVIEPLGCARQFQSFDFPSDRKIKIYLENGSILARLSDGTGEYETIRRRPLFYGFNRLHLDPEGVWLAFSDLFAFGLILLAITGILLRRGRQGLVGRGKWLMGAGFLLPVIMLVLVG